MYIEIESVLFFIIFEWLFERQKQNIAIVTFKYASITWRKIYYMNQGIIVIVPYVNWAEGIFEW